MPTCPTSWLNAPLWLRQRAEAQPRQRVRRSGYCRRASRRTKPGPLRTRPAPRQKAHRRPCGTRHRRLCVKPVVDRRKGIDVDQRDADELAIPFGSRLRVGAPANHRAKADPLAKAADIARLARPHRAPLAQIQPQMPDHGCFLPQLPARRRCSRRWQGHKRASPKRLVQFRPLDAGFASL